MTIPTSTTTGKAARDSALKDASSGAERSGSGEGGLGGKLNVPVMIAVGVAFGGTTEEAEGQSGNSGLAR